MCMFHPNQPFLFVSVTQKLSQKARLSRPHLEQGRLPRSANNLRNTKPRGLPGQHHSSTSFNNFPLQEFADHSLFTVMEPKKRQLLRLIQIFFFKQEIAAISVDMLHVNYDKNQTLKCLIDGFSLPHNEQR